MYFKTQKNKKSLKKIALYCLICFLGGSFIEQSLAGGAISPYADILKNELIKSLIKDKVCENYDACREILQMQAAGYSKIYLNMYEQPNTVLFSHVASFFITKGSKITNGTPIILSFYPYSIDYYNAFGKRKYFIRLEINK